MKNKTIQIIALVLILGLFVSVPMNTLAQNYPNPELGQNLGMDQVSTNDFNQSLDPLLQGLNQGMMVNSNVDQLYFAGDLTHYTLGKEDIIEIKVLRHPEVSGVYLVNSEGKIQYEFVGDINVEGFNKDELKNVLSELLSSYIISPEIQIKIVGFNSKIIYVIGEVARPGKIIMHGDTMTVREALIQAGLPLLTAKTSKSLLITPSNDGKPDNKKVNVHKLLYKGDLRENLVMTPGDTLYVPPTIMAKTMRVIAPVAAPISTAAGTGRTVTTGF